MLRKTAEQPPPINPVKNGNTPRRDNGPNNPNVAPSNPIINTRCVTQHPRPRQGFAGCRRGPAQFGADHPCETWHLHGQNQDKTRHPGHCVATSPRRAQDRGCRRRRPSGPGLPPFVPMSRGFSWSCPRQAIRGITIKRPGPGEPFRPMRPGGVRADQMAGRLGLFDLGTPWGAAVCYVEYRRRHAPQPDPHHL